MRMERKKVSKAPQKSNKKNRSMRLMRKKPFSITTATEAVQAR